MNVLRYILRPLWNKFLDIPDTVDWKAVGRCTVSAEPVEQPKLRLL